MTILLKEQLSITRLIPHLLIILRLLPLGIHVLQSRETQLDLMVHQQVLQALHLKAGGGEQEVAAQL